MIPYHVLLGDSLVLHTYGETSTNMFCTLFPKYVTVNCKQIVIELFIA